MKKININEGMKDMYFDEKSKQWDTDYRAQRAKKVGIEIESYIGKDKKLRALEFGCGTGLVSSNLTHRFSEILMMDLSEGMIEQLKIKIQENHIDNMKTWCGDVFNFNDEEKFDVIYTSMALHHITEVSGVVKKLYTLLKNNGKLVVVDLCPDGGSFHDEVSDFHGHNGFELSYMEELLREAEFEKISSNVFYTGNKIVEDKPHPYQLFSMCGIKK
ncbi:class I SAM-dependent methyltransferase [Clostridium sp.]|uniref:class I SAM-dependent DNA methyltransferase n=1 Tax=Clostridium sp. TaxID=1506 RepID=UPI003217203C